MKIVCECIVTVEERFNENQGTEDASFICKTIVPGNRLYGELELSVPGKKKKKKMNLIFNYCPICGEKYPEWD